MYVLYGKATFTTKGRRDTAVTKIGTAATTRGFATLAYEGHGPGVLTVGTTGLTIGYQHADSDVVDAAFGAVMAALVAGAFDGYAGAQVL